MDEHDDLTARLRRLGAQPLDPQREARDLTAMAAVQPRERRWWSAAPKLRVAAAFLAGLLVGGTGLAAADALPDPAQHVAHTVLAQVGVDVPNPPRYHGPECGTEVKANHGAYVRDDKALARSDCGKPVKGAAGSDADEGTGEGRGAAKGPCQGPPPWARDTSMTPQEVAAAKAERAAACGTDDADDATEVDEADEADRSAEVDETTTTIEEATTTTSEATTTTDATTTTTAG